MVAQQAEERKWTAPAWIPATFRGYRRLTASLGEPLTRRLQQVIDRLGGRNTDLERLLLTPSAPPGFFLMDAYRRDLGITDEDPQLNTLGEAALAFYLYCRVQDDLVDEPDACDRATVYLAEVLEGASMQAFVRAVGTGFLTFRVETMRAFAEYAIRDAEGQAAVPLSDPVLSYADFLEAGNKLLPIAVPLGALAHAGGCPHHCPALFRFARFLGAGLQATNDILNVAEDHAGGNATPVLRRLYAAGSLERDAPPGRARGALLETLVLRFALDRAEEMLESAAQTALEIGAERLAGVARMRQEYLHSVPGRLLALALGRAAKWH